MPPSPVGITGIGTCRHTPRPPRVSPGARAPGNMSGVRPARPARGTRLDPHAYALQRRRIPRAPCAPRLYIPRTCIAMRAKVPWTTKKVPWKGAGKRAWAVSSRSQITEAQRLHSYEAGALTLDEYNEMKRGLLASPPPVAPPPPPGTSKKRHQVADKKYVQAVKKPKKETAPWPCQKKGDVERLRELISKHKRLSTEPISSVFKYEEHGDWADKSSWSTEVYPLHSAAKYGKRQCVTLLLENGVDVDKGYTEKTSANKKKRYIVSGESRAPLYATTRLESYGMPGEHTGCVEAPLKAGARPSLGKKNSEDGHQNEPSPASQYDIDVVKCMCERLKLPITK